jgi:hypothetical protein
MAPRGPLSDLMNAGVRSRSFITQLTGITNAMVRRLMRRRSALEAVVGRRAAAHNAAFDRNSGRSNWAQAGLPRRALHLHPAAVAPALPAGTGTTSSVRWSITLPARTARRTALADAEWRLPVGQIMTCASATARAPCRTMPC